MRTHNIRFHDKIRKTSLNICFLELLDKFCRDWKEFESSTLNEASVFEPLSLYCSICAWSRIKQKNPFFWDNTGKLHYKVVVILSLSTEHGRNSPLTEILNTKALKISQLVLMTEMDVVVSQCVNPFWSRDPRGGGGVTLNFACYFLFWFRIFNFTMFLGFGEKWLFFLVLTICRYFCFGHFHNWLFFGGLSNIFVFCGIL